MLYQKALFILFLINSFIIGSEIANIYKNDRLSIAHNGFSEGLKEFNNDNTQEAKYILLGVLIIGQKNMIHNFHLSIHKLFPLFTIQL